MKFILLSLLFLCVSCGGLLVKDIGLPAFDSNYPTAEFSACGRLHHGLAVCSIEEDELYNSIDLKVQGYYSGQVKIASPDCLLASPEVLRYENNQSIPIKIMGLATKSCVIEFIVMPEYPNEDRTPIEIHNFKGLIYVKKYPKGSSIITQSLKVRQFSNISIPINIGEYSGPARLVFFGCDGNYDSNIEFIDGRFSLLLRDVVPLDIARSCVLNGALIFNGGKIRITYLLSIYDKMFNQLSTPSVHVGKKKITVTASESVSIISLDNEYKIKQKAKFKFKHDQSHILRLLTVKGRSVLGLWDINNQRFRWIQ